MAYEPTDWKNREVERPRTFTLQNNDDGTVTLIPAEGKVTEPGTPIVAPLLNKIEDQLVVLDDRTLNMYSLTDGTKTRDFPSGHINDLKETGHYSTASPSMARGFPNNIGLTVLIHVYLGADGALVQEILYINGGSSLKYFRTQSVSAGSWSGWSLLPFLGDNLKANREQMNLLTPTGNAGWNLSNSRYYKDEFGVVHFYLNAIVGTKNESTFITPGLPEGYRPYAGVFQPFIVQTSGGVTKVYQNAMGLSSSGDMIVSAAIPSDGVTAYGYFTFKTTP